MSFVTTTFVILVKTSAEQTSLYAIIVITVTSHTKIAKQFVMIVGRRRTQENGSVVLWSHVIMTFVMSVFKANE